MYIGKYVRKPFTWRYHGNYVGPNWSGGRYGPSLANSRVKALDEFDETGRIHDRSYAIGHDLKRADYKFYRQNIGRGWKRSAAAIAVGIQGFFRSSENKKELMVVKRKRSQSRSRSRGRASKRIIYPSPTRTNSAVTIYEPPGYRSRSRSRSMSVYVPKQRYKTSTQSSLGGRLRKNKSKRKSKAARTNDMMQAQSKGTLITHEFGGQIPAIVESHYIGHATHCFDKIGKAVFRGLLKLLFKKMGIQIMNWDEPVTNDYVLAGGDNFRITWRDQELVGDGETFSSTSVNITTGTKTYKELAEEWWNGYYAAPDRSMQPYFTKLTYTPASSKFQTVEINLAKAMVHLDIKSTFKLQNISNNIAGDNNESDAVDNVPLYGRSYSGNGNGSTFRGNIQNAPIPGGGGTATLNFLADRITGIISQSGSAYSVIKEPPPHKNFKEVKQSAKLTLMPGQIKTSTLIHNKGISLDRLMGALIPEITTGLSAQKSILYMGKFAFFGLEKVMDCNTNPFELAYEHNLSLGCYIQTKQTYVSLPLFEKLLL